MSSSKRYVLREKRKARIRGKVSGTVARPRLSVFRSLSSFSAQLIDDENGVTVAAVLVKEGNLEGAKKAASLLAQKYSGPCVFDRNGYAYHGRVQAFADAARQGGLQF